jgi:hypothetical protein
MRPVKLESGVQQVYLKLYGLCFLKKQWIPTAVFGEFWHHLENRRREVCGSVMQENVLVRTTNLPVNA